MLSTKLSRYPWELEQRQRLAQRYNEAFVDLKKYSVHTPVVRSNCTSVWAQYTLWVPDREKFQAHLQKKNVPTAVHYPITMADQPAYRETSTIHDISVARLAAKHVVSLPMYPDMTIGIQDQIIGAVRGAYL